MRFTSFFEYCNLSSWRGIWKCQGFGSSETLAYFKNKTKPKHTHKKAQETFAFLYFCRDKKRLQNSGIDDFLDFVALGVFFLLDSGHGGVDTVLKHKLV